MSCLRLPARRAPGPSCQQSERVRHCGCTARIKAVANAVGAAASTAYARPETSSEASRTGSLMLAPITADAQRAAYRIDRRARSLGPSDHA